MAEEKIDVKDKKKEIKDTFQLTEVATQTEIVIKNELTGDILNQSQVLALVLNKLDRIEKAVN